MSLQTIKKIAVCLGVLAITTCKKESAQKRENLNPAVASVNPPIGGPTSPVTPGSGSPVPGESSSPADDPIAQLQKECGVNLADLADPNKIIFQGKYRSLPIVVTGSVFIVSYKVVVQAVLSILSKNSGGTQNIVVSVLEASPKIFAQKKAEDAAQKASSSSQGTGVSQSEMSKIGAVNKQFDGLLCALTSTKESTSSSSGSFSYEPGLPSTISPFASVSKQQKEIGQGRDFDVVVTVRSSNNGLTPGTKISGRVSVRPVDPNLVIQQNGQNVTIQGKSAYMISNMFQSEQTTVALGMPLRTVFFTNSDLKKFVAIVADTGQEMQGNRLAPTVFLPE